ncbi:MAG: type II toxin-antitoxin system RelE/ParE family toxin [Candidatus Omnitrophica bacterium]|nr:type II toxin-antitoxin system RelE/ParE family toxin [Candidatus Omnitrophota bacterium]
MMAPYKVVWHQNIKKDFAKIPARLTESIVTSIEHKLSSAPEFLGQPLKGTAVQLWRTVYSQYRIIYTIQAQAKEVWVLSVMKREVVYRNAHIQSLVHLAVAIQKRF